MNLFQQGSLLVIEDTFVFSRDEVKEKLPELQRFAETGSIKATEKKHTFIYKDMIFTQYDGFVDRDKGYCPKFFDTWEQAAVVYSDLFGFNSPVKIEAIEVAKNKLGAYVEAQYA